MGFDVFLILLNVIRFTKSDYNFKQHKKMKHEYKTKENTDYNAFFVQK